MLQKINGAENKIVPHCLSEYNILCSTEETHIGLEQHEN